MKINNKFIALHNSHTTNNKVKFSSCLLVTLLGAITTLSAQSVSIDEFHNGNARDTFEMIGNLQTAVPFTQSGSSGSGISYTSGGIDAAFTSITSAALGGSRSIRLTRPTSPLFNSGELVSRLIFGTSSQLIYINNPEQFQTIPTALAPNAVSNLTLTYGSTVSLAQNFSALTHLELILTETSQAMPFSITLTDTSGGTHTASSSSFAGTPTGDTLVIPGGGPTYDQVQVLTPLAAFSSNGINLSSIDQISLTANLGANDLTQITGFNAIVAPVPEPSTSLLFLLSSGFLMLRRQR